MSKIIFSFLVVLLGISMYINFTQYQELNHNKTTIQQMAQSVKNKRTTDRSEKKETSELENQIDTLKTENNWLKNNDKDTKETTQAFQETTENLFKALTDFDADTYEQRKAAAEPYLSADLLKLYFSDTPNRGDSNQTDSRLVEVTLYSQAIQGEHMKGLVVSRYESRVNSSNWTKGLTLFEVEYDTQSKKITKIQNLGSGYTGDMID